MDYRLLINGDLVEGASTLEVTDPATGRPFARCARSDEALANLAIAAAKEAFPAWAATPHARRAELLARWADALEARFADLAALLTSEQGKPSQEANFEVGAAIAALRTLGAIELADEVLVDDATDRIIEQRTPLGVVATITPWNFPLILLMVKAASALGTGNTVVAKPAPTTPLTTLLAAELAADILPPGVFNTIVDANDLGPLITGHPDIAKVSFTGSSDTGRKVMAGAAGSLKRLTLELGGNDVAILLDDADVAAAAPRIFAAATINAGQVCMAAKRIYAPRALYDALCDELARLAREAVVDSGRNQGTQIGPLQNRQQYEKVLEIITDAKRRGRVIAGGEPLAREGYFIPPTVVRDLPDDARLVREEQFAPVIPVLAYDDLDDLVRRANDSEYGLAGSIWTSNVERGAELARRIDAGTVWINKHLDLRFDVPFGGAKQSGIGREQGREGLKEFTQVKVISAAKAPLA
jgi:acyl-CoA reductase-like NAD-dependent aldehyde dehydrogenase